MCRCIVMLFIVDKMLMLLLLWWLLGGIFLRSKPCWNCAGSRKEVKTNVLECEKRLDGFKKTARFVVATARRVATVRLWCATMTVVDRNGGTMGMREKRWICPGGRRTRRLGEKSDGETQRRKDGGLFIFSEKSESGGACAWQTLT